MAPSSAQLERETEQARAQFQASLHELRYRITPGQLLDQIIDYTGPGPIGDLAGNFRDQAVRRPIALALLVLGVAWLMLPARGNGSAPAASGHQKGPQVSPGLAEESARLAPAGTFAETAAAGSGAANAEAGGFLPPPPASMGSRVVALCREQPLVVAGAGVAVGAAVGVALGALVSRRGGDPSVWNAGKWLKRTGGQEEASAGLREAPPTPHELYGVSGESLVDIDETVHLAPAQGGRAHPDTPGCLDEEAR